MLSNYQKRAGGALPTAIRAIRLNLGLNGKAFGLLIGASQAEVSKYESGAGTPGAMRLVRLIRVAAADQLEVLLCELSKHGLSAHDISTPLASQIGERPAASIPTPSDASIQQQPKEGNV